MMDRNWVSEKECQSLHSDMAPALSKFIVWWENKLGGGGGEGRAESSKGHGVPVLQ